MATAAPTTPFVWGAGGSIRTPEQVAREREIAAALMMEGVDYSPVGHWLAGAARASQAGLGALKDWRANDAETEGREGFQTRWNSVFGGGAAPVAADPVAAALVAPQTAADAVNAVGAVPSGTSADYIRQGLVGRGLPEHVADAFILNMQDESGLNPGINEAQPLVPGSRGGFGLYQLTGPRRRAYEQFAQERGVSPDDVDAQLDFLMMELQGPEAQAAQAILSAPDTGTAAAAIVNQFLRPAEEHRARRAAAYTGGAAGAPVQVAQAGGMGSPDIASLIGLASDPWANDSQQQILQALMGQQMQQKDPAYQLDLALKQAQLDAALNPTVEAPKPIEVGGVLVDPITYQPLFDSRQQGNDPTSAMQNYEYLVSQGMAPDQALERAFSGGTTVNVGQGEVGTIPPGYELVTDPATGARSMRLIPGGPADLEAQAAASAAETGQQQQATYANIVSEDIDRALSIIEQDGNFSTGMIGQLLRNLPGSGAARLDNLLTTVRANTSFDRLQAMRESSPTGGALGSVTENELRLLQNAIGSLETSNTAEDLTFNLKRVQQVYNEIIHGPGGAPNQSTVPATDIDALLEKYQ